MLIYDVTEEDSYKSLANWMQEVERYSEGDVLIVLVANKVDLGNRTVSKDDAAELAQEYGIPYFETSAKEGTGVDAPFNEMGKLLLQKRREE
mmetsp:Transcript_14886/g.16537  ORF Transcript_14886/g.16537 Transcript_14886/m.16537 type:complete len:92 (+) Transcript_14886:365-640(+)